MKKKIKITDLTREELLVLVSNRCGFGLTESDLLRAKEDASYQHAKAAFKGAEEASQLWESTKTHQAYNALMEAYAIHERAYKKYEICIRKRNN